LQFLFLFSFLHPLYWAKRARGSLSLVLFIVQGEGVCLDLFFYSARRARGSLFLALFIVQGEGVCLGVFFYWARRARGSLLLALFIVRGGRRGVPWF
jgi:hypothetical protein